MNEKVMIYDPNPLIVAGLDMLLSEQAFQIVRATSDMDVFLRDLWFLKPDIVVLDPMPVGEKAITGIRLAQHVHNDLKIVILAGSEGTEHILRGYELKFNVCLNKSAAVQKILAAVSYLSQRSSTKESVEEFKPHDLKFFFRLTSREIQVLSKLAIGKSNIAIAQELTLSNKTISTYKRSIMKKLKINTNKEIIEFTRRHGF